MKSEKKPWRVWKDTWAVVDSIELWWRVWSLAIVRAATVAFWADNVGWPHDGQVAWGHASLGGVAGHSMQVMNQVWQGPASKQFSIVPVRTYGGICISSGYVHSTGVLQNVRMFGKKVPLSVIRRSGPWGQSAHFFKAIRNAAVVSHNAYDCQLRFKTGFWPGREGKWRREGYSEAIDRRICVNENLRGTHTHPRTRARICKHTGVESSSFC